MKKEYFLLILAIIVLSAYLFFHNKNSDNYSLPEIGNIDEAKIESIEITQNNKTINCFKDNGVWVVTENKFPADKNIILEMTASISNLTITTLISEKENLQRYDLDKDKAILVIAKSNNKIIRQFYIGKTAPTQKHTFITLDDQKAAFHAKGNLRRMFNKSIDNLRDKQIQKFDQTQIKSIEVSKGDLKRIITKKQFAKETAEENKEDTAEKKTEWQCQDNAELKQESANSVINTLSNLRCSSYLETQTKSDFENKTPFLKIVLKADKAFELILFPKTEQNKYIGISSESKYLFLLEDHIADDIISHADKLLNIKPESADEENS
jgi:Domain of unknown function (DUF4340)